MFNQYFGQYLLNKEILTAKQLRDAIEQEHFTKAKLGVLAMNAGFMTAEQVEEVHKLQWKVDQRFGEIAVTKGYLTEGRMKLLLNEQKNTSLSLGQVVIDKGYLTFGQLETALVNFKKDTDTLGGSYDISQVSNGLDSALNKICSDYAALFFRNITRLLNDVPVLNSNIARPFNELEPIKGWFVSQDISGPIHLLTGIIMDDTTLLEFARRYSDEDLISIDLLAQDSITEFLNVHNGIFSVNMSNQGVNLELGAPGIGNYSKIDNGCRIPIQLSFGTIDLIIARKGC